MIFFHKEILRQLQFAFNTVKMVLKSKNFAFNMMYVLMNMSKKMESLYLSTVKILHGHLNGGMKMTNWLVMTSI